MPKRSTGVAPDRTEFLSRLTYCWESLGSKNKLAKAAGLPSSTVRGYLKRGAEPQRDALIRIAAAAQVSLEWLVIGSGPRDVDARHSSVRYGVKDDLRGTETIIQAAASTFNVPVEFARMRLVGSTEMQALSNAVADWGTYVTIPVVGEPRAWGTLQRSILESILPAGCDPSKIAAVQNLGENYAPLRPGDWLLIDTAAPIEKGLYCARGHDSGIHFLQLDGVSDHAFIIRESIGETQALKPKHMSKYEFEKTHVIVGRIVLGLSVVLFNGEGPVQGRQA